MKPKHMELAMSMFDDESTLAQSPNQSLKLEMFKIPGDQSINETMSQQSQWRNGRSIMMQSF